MPSLHHPSARYALYEHPATPIPVSSTVTSAAVEEARDRRKTAEALLKAMREGKAQNGAPVLAPVDFTARSGNDLRPAHLRDVVGQERIKAMFDRILFAAERDDRALDHMLLVGSAGTGKTTLALVVANELHRNVYMLKAPVAYSTLDQLRQVAHDRDVVVIDEIHMQVSGDRRGVTEAADPELFYAVMEDARLQTPTGVEPFPRVTFIGCTTDAGLLPEPFLDRFPLRPQLDPYTLADMARLAVDNAARLGMDIDGAGATVLAEACRRTPRQINTYVRNAKSLGTLLIDRAVAVEVVVELNSTTLDGLTRDMQAMLSYLLRCKREDARGNVVYQAGLGSIATALGKSRDSKSVALYVEPYLIAQGFVAITHGGRALTELGATRARSL